MISYVLDSSALIRYLDDEAGSDRVEALLAECAAGRAGVLISAIQWGEVAGNVRRRFGAAQQVRVLSRLPSEVEVVPATAQRAVSAAELRVDRKIAYADAFALELAMQSPEHVLVTADYGFKSVEDFARVEFLPAK